MMFSLFSFFPPIQFGNFGNSVEILFALINGDSIWLIFRAFKEEDIFIYIYSRLFVYLFIFLFIYAVLNLFTSLVKTAYDNSSVRILNNLRLLCTINYNGSIYTHRYYFYTFNTPSFPF